jgi:hypothetical protein
METNNNLSSQSSANLNEAAKWANILAMIGFGTLGLTTLWFLYMLFLAKGLPIGGGRIMITFIVFVIVMAIYIIPYYYMYKFAQGMKNSNIDEGIANLKSYFKFISILTIISVSLSVLAYLFLYLSM